MTIIPCSLKKRILTKRLPACALVAVFALAATQCAIAGEKDAASLRRLIGPYVKPIEAVAVKSGANAKADLGRMLFYDQRLSGNGAISCNDCHDLSNYGANGVHAQKLREQDKLVRDVPTVYNSSDMMLFDWDGRHKTIIDKTAASILNKHELGVAKKEDLMAGLSKISGYKTIFAQAFPGDSAPISFDNAVAALVEFQKGLTTPAPIDRFIKGDDSALTTDQLKGGFLFDANNCAACHTGTNFGGQMLQKLGTMRPWPNQEDLGHFLVSKDVTHKMIFRVAPLRNISKTAPYFHDGSSRRVWHAIKRMGEYEAGRAIAVQDVLAIQSFFESFTGELPMDYIKKPNLPQ